MTDNWQNLESEMSAMRPRAVSPELIDRIGSRIEAGEARPWADRMLIGAIGASALAACVIATILWSEPRRWTPPVMPSMARTDSPRVGDASLAIARADARWGDALR